MVPDPGCEYAGRGVRCDRVVYALAPPSAGCACRPGRNCQRGRTRAPGGRFSTDAGRWKFGDSSMAKPAIQTLSTSQERVLRSCAAGRSGGWRQFVRGTVCAHHDSFAVYACAADGAELRRAAGRAAAGQPARICGARSLFGGRRDGNAGVQSYGCGRGRAVAQVRRADSCWLIRWWRGLAGFVMERGRKNLLAPRWAACSARLCFLPEV